MSPQGPTRAARHPSGAPPGVLAGIGPLPPGVRRVLGHPLVGALTTPHGISRYLEAVSPLWSLEGGRALVTGVAAETPDMVTLTLRPDHAWRGFRAGQHVRIGVAIDGVRHTRTYSVTCSEHRRDDHLTITVKRKGGGIVSGHLTTRLQPGDVVACTGATGDVVLPDPRPARLLLVSGGSGITPLASMLRTLADEQHTGEVTFLHYARTAEDVPFATDLARIGGSMPGAEVVVVPTARGRPGRRTGRFAASHLETLVPDHLDVPTYVCGPTGLVDAVEHHYTVNGAADRLAVERFTPPALQRSTGPGGGVVRFAASGVERPDDGRPLLEQAESEGLTPAFGCRMGICHTCTLPRVAGATIDLRNGRRSDAPDQRIQPCVSVAAGDVILDL